MSSFALKVGNSSDHFLGNFRGRLQGGDPLTINQPAAWLVAKIRLEFSLVSLARLAKIRMMRGSPRVSTVSGMLPDVAAEAAASAGKEGYANASGKPTAAAP